MNAVHHQAPQAVAPAPMSVTHSAVAAIFNAPQAPADLAELQLLDIRGVCALVGLKSTAIQDRVRAGIFPAPVRMSLRCSRWPAGAVRQWLQAQIDAQQEDIKQRQQARAKKASNAAQAKRHAIAQQGGTQ